MSGGGTRTYKYPMTSWGGRMRSSLKLPQRAREWLNDYGFRVYFLGNVFVNLAYI